jgi:hypothetical protein
MEAIGYWIPYDQSITKLWYRVEKQDHAYLVHKKIDVKREEKRNKLAT